MSKAILDHHINLVLDTTSDEDRMATANRLRKLICAKLDDVEDIVASLSMLN